MIAERFGYWPWAIKDERIDDVLACMAVLGAEARARALLEGLSHDEPLIREE